MWPIVVGAALVAAWSPLAVPRTTTRTAVRMKQAEAPEEHASPNIDIDAVVEFHAATHGNGNNPSVLGLVKGFESKAKGATKVTIVAADDKTYCVRQQDIHIVLPAYKGKLKVTSEILQEYEAVKSLEAFELGVQPEELELAWELCAESTASSLSPKAIMDVLDETMLKSGVDRYKAFRLLTSDLGKVFFKALSGNEYKAKAAKAVRASKDNWCRGSMDDGHGASEEWCFV